MNTSHLVNLSAVKKREKIGKISNITRSPPVELEHFSNRLGMIPKKLKDPRYLRLKRDFIRDKPKIEVKIDTKNSKDRYYSLQRVGEERRERIYIPPVKELPKRMAGLKSEFK